MNFGYINQTVGGSWLSHINNWGDIHTRFKMHISATFTPPDQKPPAVLHPEHNFCWPLLNLKNPACVLIWTGGNSGFQKWWHRRIWPTIHVESSIMMSVHFPQTCCDWKRIIPSCSEESMQVQDADSPSDVWMNSLPFEEVDGHKHGDPSFCYRGLFSSTQRLRHSQRDFNQTAYIHCCLVWQQRYWDL